MSLEITSGTTNKYVGLQKTVSKRDPTKEEAKVEPPKTLGRFIYICEIFY